MILGGIQTDQFDDPGGQAPVDPASIPTSDLPKVVLEAQLAAQRLQADYLELLAEAKRRRCTRDTIHRSQAIWLADSIRVSKAAAGKQVNQAQMLFSDFPQLGRAYRSGMITDSHLGLFTRIWNRTELRDAFTRDLGGLIGFTQKPWAICRELFDAWETLVDPIDPNDHAAKSHARRGFTFGNGLDHVVLGELNTTTAFWAQIEPVLQAKVDELFEADWAEARDREGVLACGDDLLRNDAQRWHDALVIVIRQGAGADDPGTSVTAAVVIDHETMTEEAERRDAVARGEEPPPRSVADALARAGTYRCETASGMPLSPSDALDYAIAGHVRLFVMNAKTRDFTASASARLFKGAQRHGILIRDRHCQSPGCDTRAWHCEVDHLTRHTDAGQTIPVNAETKCGPCHRHKTRLETLGIWPPIRN